MAELSVEGSDLVLHLTLGEKAMGVHGDLRAPLATVQRVEVLDNAHSPADHGFKIGERLPGVAEVGTVLDRGRTIFAAVHHATPRGLRIVFTNASHDEWIVGVPDPDQEVRRLGLSSHVG